MAWRFEKKCSESTAALIHVYGHEKVRISLEKDLPSVVVLRGPRSIGKSTLADYLAQYYNVLSADLKKIEILDVDKSRELQKFVIRAPYGKIKMVIINLDGPQYSTGQASSASLNALLKILEEPPHFVRFILISEHRILPTVESRSYIYTMGYLCADDVREVLIKHAGLMPREADIAASYSTGTIEQAANIDPNSFSKSNVISVLKAIHARDKDLLAYATKSWNDKSHELMLIWITEAISGKWAVFTDKESFGLEKDKKIPLILLSVLNKVPKARSRIAIKVALNTIMERK